MGHLLPQVLRIEDLDRGLVSYPASAQICLSKQRAVVFFRNTVKDAVTID